MLFVSLFLSALLGHLQEWSYSKYGKNWKEGLFYSHLLGLPYFILLGRDITDHALLAASSPSMIILEGSIPSTYFFLFLNVITQLICIYGVYMLTGAAGTVTCTLTITIRKFISLILSIIYFKNPFTTYHWVGSSLVFLGTTLYSMPQAKPKKE